MRSQSPKTAATRAAAKPIRARYVERFPYCELKRAGAEGACFGPLHVHEPWTRARGGPIDDPRNFATACNFHNEWIGQTAAGIKFGRATGLLITRAAGPAWLQGGGRWPGLTQEEAERAIFGPSETG